MKTIAIYNIKGGVGKTATAVNLSFLASLDGANTLLWDLDPQGAASYYFRIKAEIEGGGKKLIDGETNIDAAVKGTDYEYLDLLPADFTYRNMDTFLEQTDDPVNRFNKLLKPFSEEYDYIFLDCPPSISAVSESVFAAADILLVPTIPTTLSLRTYQQIIAFFEQQGIEQKKVLPFFVMVDSRKKMHRLIVQHPPRFMPSLIKSYIPYASEVERMGVHRAPLTVFAARSKAAKCYTSMWDELRAYIYSIS
ncbi:MAG: AAA family ATPase [Gammaproteobacteria bacterium]|nr:AAA family ATPase [Gammaproteobacteria bacterium]